MNLVVIFLVAALIVVVSIIANSKSQHKEEEKSEPLVNSNFGVEVESPAALVVAPPEVVSDVELEKLAKTKVKKAVKSPAVIKSTKTTSKTAATTAAKKPVIKKIK